MYCVSQKYNSLQTAWLSHSLLVLSESDRKICSQTQWHGGQGVEWLWESAVKISEIFLKLTDTAVPQ